MPKVLRGEQINRFKEKFSKLNREEKKLVVDNVKVGKDGNLTINNYSKVVAVMKLHDDEIEIFPNRLRLK